MKSTVLTSNRQTMSMRWKPTKGARTHKYILTFFLIFDDKKLLRSHYTDSRKEKQINLNLTCQFDCFMKIIPPGEVEPPLPRPKNFEKKMICFSNNFHKTSGITTRFVKITNYKLLLILFFTLIKIRIFFLF